MNAVEFLQTVWPAQGMYCIALGPYTRPDTGRGYFKHYAFKAIAEAAAFALRKTLAEPGVFFAVHTIKGYVTAKKPDGSTYQKAERTVANMAYTQVFHGDLDCGEGKPYATRKEALLALHEFLKATGLPWPLAVKSGNGVHLYWLLETAMTSEEWAPWGQMLKEIAAHYGFHLDPAATADVSRVLRVVGTFHKKDPLNPLKVRVLPGPGGAPTPRTSNAVFLAIMTEAAKVLPEPEVAEAARQSGPPPSPTDVAKVCPTFVKMVKEADVATGREWMLTNTLCLHTTGGSKLAHMIAAKHPTYNRDETEEKLKRLLDRNIGPPTCGKMQEVSEPNSPCLSCANFGRPKSSPIVFARRLPTTELPSEVPPPQQPYARTKRGIEFQPPTAPGAAVPPPSRVICPFDFYPTEVVDEAWAETKGVTWTAVLPIKGKVDFRLPADIYTDETKLISHLAHKGVTLDKHHAKTLGGYVSHYIRLLQAHREEQAQHESFGWTVDRKQFVASKDRVLTKDGDKPAILSPMLANVAANLHAKGTLAGQVKALRFWKHRDYVRQQILILSSIGAPLLYMTDHFGVIVNLSGPSGAAKTTALHSASGIWGRPERLTMGGTDDDTTANGRAGRLRIMANLPVCVDEITLMPAEQIKRMAMSVTGLGEKVRLKRDGTERHIPDTAKSTLMLCTSNNSVHALMAMNNQAGNAGSMRVLELPCPRLNVHTKSEADAFVREMRANYGHLGPEFIQYVMRNMEAVEAEMAAVMAEVDKRCRIEQHERFWAADISVVILAGRICRRLGLIDFDMDYLLEWVADVYLPSTRRVVRDSYSDPIEALQSYIESIANNLLVVSFTPGMRPTDKGLWGLERGPQGAIKGRLEAGAGVLYLAVQPLRDYCDHRKFIYDTMVGELVHKGVMTREKMDLTRHINNYAAGLAWTLRVDLNHELMAGHAPVKADDQTVVFLYPGKKNAG